MKSKLIIFVLISLTTISCTPDIDKNSNAVYIFNSELSADYKDTKIAFEKKRTAITFESKFVANNCIEYLSEIKKSELKGTSFNRVIQNEYISCEALDLIKNKIVSTTNKASLSYGNDIATRLDLSSFPSSLNRRSRKNNKTLSDFDSGKLTIDLFTAKWDSDDWTYEIEIIASTDLNNDKIDDLIIWIHDKAKQGSYNSYSTLIVLLHDTNKRLEAIPYNEWHP